MLHSYLSYLYFQEPLPPSLVDSNQSISQDFKNNESTSRNMFTVLQNSFFTICTILYPTQPKQLLGELVLGARQTPHLILLQLAV